MSSNLVGCAILRPQQNYKRKNLVSYLTIHWGLEILLDNMTKKPAYNEAGFINQNLVLIESCLPWQLYPL